MKSCVFCGQPGESNEHIISFSVRARAQLSDQEIEVGAREGDVDGLFRRAHRLDSFVTRRACRSCNNGWMSKLEKEFLMFAGPLIEPRWPTDSQPHASKCVEGRVPISRWILKTAIMASLAGTAPRAFPPEFCSNLHAGGISDGTRLSLTKIVEPQPLLVVLNRGFWFLENGEMRWKGAESGRSFDLLFQINHLGLRLINAPGVQLGFVPPQTTLPLNENEPSFDTLEQFEKTLVARVPIAL